MVQAILQATWCMHSLSLIHIFNLLREGLDLPEVSLVAILDADKEGFLRSETSLIQTIGRAARNAEGLVIMYADEVTDSMDPVSYTHLRWPAGCRFAVSGAERPVSAQ